MYEASNHLPMPAVRTSRVVLPAADLIVHLTNACLWILAVLAFASTPARAAAYSVLHGLVAALMFALSKADRSAGSTPRVVRFLHHWGPAVVLVAFFFELGVIVPRVHSFDDRRYDHALQAFDLWLLGDPVALVAQYGSRGLSDILAVCYGAYFPLTVTIPAVLYARGELAAFYRAASILMIGFVLTYAGYLVCPAVGPHLAFDGPRHAVLDGYGLARRAHAILRTVPIEPPDAFPSGHALMGMLAPALAYRFCRPLFVWLLPLGVGIVFATLYLRYHYVMDVLAAALAAPLAWKIGCRLDDYVASRGAERSNHRVVA